MPERFPHIDATISQYALWAERLAALWVDMDAAYTSVARQYGFACRGCEDNCCRTRFYHHTLLEYHSLYDGFRKLAVGRQHEIRQRAQIVGLYQARADRNIAHPDHMCPLNQDGLCCLYEHRPMICRLHGLPHELRPGGRVVRGPGCDLFMALCGNGPYIDFDRTPFYTRMAALEKGLRRDTGYHTKLKMTVAEMVCSFYIGTGQ